MKYRRPYQRQRAQRQRGKLVVQGRIHVHSKEKKSLSPLMVWVLTNGVETPGPRVSPPVSDMSGVTASPTKHIH